MVAQLGLFISDLVTFSIRYKTPMADFRSMRENRDGGSPQTELRNSPFQRRVWPFFG